MTAYELRQELVRRNAFDIDEDKANYKSMLQRLMVELVKEEEAATIERVAAVEQQQQLQRDQAKREREQRKQEALERSKLRQTNPQYFLSKAELNVPPPKITEDDGHSASNDDVESNKAEEFDSDPFKPKFKSKIFTRWQDCNYGRSYLCFFEYFVQKYKILKILCPAISIFTAL